MSIDEDKPNKDSVRNYSFDKGQRVSLKSNFSKKGRIDFVHEPQGGYQYYDIILDDGIQHTLAEHEILEEVIASTSWDLLANNLLSDYRDFSIATTLYKVRNTTSNTISSLKASRTIFYPYQFKPLVKFLQSDTKRILIADEVGLGKTIEAGHILLELAARGSLRNALVVCSNSLKDKWKTELQEKFNFTFKIYTSTKEFLTDIKDETTGHKKSLFGIINYEKFRNEDVLSVLNENNYTFDLLICDEAHRIRNSGTAQHKGVAKLVDYSEAVVFMTATPIMTELQNLHSLIRLLDKQAFDTYAIFNNAVNQNRPFIKAVSALNAGGKLAVIADELHTAIVPQEMMIDNIPIYRVEKTVSELFQEDPLYARVRERLLHYDNSVQNRVLIQRDLVELNSLNYLYTRTRKKDVREDKDVTVRKASSINVEIGAQEREIYDSLMHQYDSSANLGLITKKRQMASCIVGAITPREDLLKGIYNQNIPDSKFALLCDLVDKIVKKEGKKLIVFAFFKNTLLYLHLKLNEIDLVCEIIHGDIKDRTERISRFQHDDRVNILLSSEVGSEGIDLQFCDAIVNYDLPWNPMVVEQRIGRIDRVGQKSSIIRIYNLIITNTIEERIYERLYDRINLFRESIGDLEEILGEKESLGAQISEGIEKLYRTELTKQEEEELFESLHHAIENNKQILRTIQQSLSEAFANDLHFQNEIEYITRNNRYLTKQEIIKYIESLIRYLLSTLHIEHLNDLESRISIPANNLNTLFDFIEKYKDPIHINPELETLYRRFKRFEGSREIVITFDQQYAYEHKMVEYISSFHPLVNAATNYFEQNGFKQNQANRIAIKKESLAAEHHISPGYYILAIYSVSIVKDFGNGMPRQLDYLRSALCDMNGDEPVMLDSNIAEYIYGHVQLYGEQMLTSIPLNREFVEAIRSPIVMKMKEDENSTRIDEEIRFTSSINRRAEQEINYINNRLSRLQQQLANGQGIEAILRSNADELSTRKRRILENQEKTKIEVSSKPISVNLLQVV